MSKMTGQVKFYTTHSAARKLLVTPTTIIAWIKQGKIKAMRTDGNHRRILPEEIDRLYEKMKADTEGRK